MRRAYRRGARSRYNKKINHLPRRDRRRASDRLDTLLKGVMEEIKYELHGLRLHKKIFTAQRTMTRDDVDL